MSNKTTVKSNVTINNTKQNVSKILLGQLISNAEVTAKDRYLPFDCRIDAVKDCIGYKLINSRYGRNHSLTAWTAENFVFHFEYGRRGGVRVSYMNNQGLQSATFQASEWGCMMDYLKRKLDRMIDNLYDEKKWVESEKLQRQLDELADHVSNGGGLRISKSISEDAMEFLKSLASSLEPVSSQPRGTTVEADRMPSDCTETKQCKDELLVEE